MPVLSKCPLCRGVMAEVRGEARCPRCGELVLPSVRKLCGVCGQDVTRTKRMRDEAGEYYCHDCWVTRLAARGEEPGYVCNTCRRIFPADQVYEENDDFICKRCFSSRNLDPNDLLEVAAHAGDEAPAVFAPQPARSQRSTATWWLIAAGTALLVLLIGVVIFLSR